MQSRSGTCFPAAAGLALVVALTVRGQPVEPAHLWRFTPAQVTEGSVRPLRGPFALALEKPLEVDGSSAVFDGDNSLTGEGVTGDQLPARDLTAAAWVALSATARWGCIVGYFQDNGSYEKGWLLGYQNDRFMFQVSTGPKLITALSPMALELDTWYHVAGTYDGDVLRLYIDGKEAASAADTDGPIDYPPKAVLTVGAYHDDNEYFRMQGRLRDVGVYGRALPAAALTERAADRPPAIAPPPVATTRPWLQFTGPGRARLRWTTGAAGKGRVVAARAGIEKVVLPCVSVGHTHTAVLDDLQPGAEYTCSVGLEDDPAENHTETFTFETTFNYTLPDVAESPELAGDSVAERMADEVLRRTDTRRGICVVYGVTNGALAYHLARRTRLIVWLVDDDEQRIEEVRARLAATGTYGTRFVAFAEASMTRTSLSDAVANLVVSERALTDGTWPGDPGEGMRLLTPGGTALLGGPAEAPAARDEWLSRTAAPGWKQVAAGPLTMAVLTRRAFPGAGAWTHQYGNAGNTATSGEDLGGARKTGDFQVQWVGRPGPDFGIDRNPRMPAPLSVGGRLFHQGMGRIIALDAYNGVVLWGLEIPQMRRVNIPRDAGNWCADDASVYVVVGDEAWQLDAATGERIGCFRLPEEMRRGHEWGVIAVQEGRLFGSAVKAGSAYTAYWGGSSWYDAKDAAAAAKVCSDGLFAYDLSTGRLLWTHKSGTVINTTVTLGGGKLYAVESRNAAVAARRSGRVAQPELWLDQAMICLDAVTGRPRWERPIDTEDGRIVFYLVYHPRRLLLVSSKGKYHLYAYDPSTGTPVWEQTHEWPGNDHSAHMMHPVVVDDMLYLEPNGYTVLDGTRVTTGMGRRSGCHTYLGSRNALIYRGTNRRVALWDRETETVSTWDRLRPSCWLSLVPAGGMLLSPEAGGGCSCGGWLETSIGFLPRAHRMPPGGDRGREATP